MIGSRPREIQRTVISLLQACPLVEGVEPFGSLSNATDDAYSDIDLRVRASDLRAAIRTRHEVLRRVGRAGIEWLVHLRPGSFCSSLLLAEESCHHRIDLEFCSAECVSQDDLQGAALAGPHPAGLYIPVPASPGHFLVGQLLGGTRYAKARKRGQSLTCWRFCSAMVDWLCVLLYEESHGWQELNRKLNTAEYLALDETVDAATVASIHDALDLSCAEKMDSAVLRILDRIVELAVRKGAAIGLPIPNPPISRLSCFLKSELNITCSKGKEAHGS